MLIDIDGKITEVADIVADTTIYDNAREIALKKEWLDNVYDKQVSEYNRCIRLNIPYDNKYGTIEELDMKAMSYINEIREYSNN